MTTTAELRARYRAARPPMSEDDWETRVMDFAKLHGWKVCHYLPAIRQSGRISTAVKGDRGGPDLQLARRGVVLLVELKTNSGTLSPEQREWLDECGEHGDVWRPRDWDRVQAILR